MSPVALRVAVLTTIVLAALGPGHAAALEVGDKAPDFVLPSSTGEPVRLSQFRGKKLVLLEFFGATRFPT